LSGEPPVTHKPIEETMAVYTVHEPPVRAGAWSAPEPERFIFVRDGFSFAALLFGPLWMLRHRMWLGLLGYGAVVPALGLVLRQAPASVAVGSSVGALLALLVGFEAGTLRRFTLGRRKWRNIGIVVGDDIESAEQRFFDSWVTRSSVGGSSIGRSRSRGEPVAPPGLSALAATLRVPQPNSDVLGLFPEPGARP
jgi:hypothetical protein